MSKKRWSFNFHKNNNCQVGKKGEIRKKPTVAFPKVLGSDKFSKTDFFKVPISEVLTSLKCTILGVAHNNVNARNLYGVRLDKFRL